MLWDEIQAGYLNDAGLVKPARQTDSNNGTLYSAEVIVVAAKRHELTDEMRDWFVRTMNLCGADTGNLRRHPEGGDIEGPDDPTGVLAAYKVMGLPDIYPKKFLDYGAHTFVRPTWRGIPLPLKVPDVFNSQAPGKWDPSAWSGRFLALLCHAYHCANQKPHPVLLLAWCVTVLLGGVTNPKDNDSRMLSWLLIASAPKTLLTRFVRAIWLWRLKREWGSMRNVAAACLYGDPEHPIAKYIPDRA